MSCCTSATKPMYTTATRDIRISSQSSSELASGVMRAGSLSEALALAEQGDGEIFVIGGSALLKAALPRATTVYETVVHAEIEGDTFIESFDFSGWHTEVLEKHPADAAHAYGFTIYRHCRASHPDYARGCE